eukprot:2071878-Prymnesium_polylepis.4
MRRTSAPECSSFASAAQISEDAPEGSSKVVGQRKQIEGHRNVRGAAVLDEHLAKGERAVLEALKLHLLGLGTRVRM